MGVRVGSGQGAVLIDLDQHPVLRSLNMEQEDWRWEDVFAADGQSRQAALGLIERIGDEEADRRAAEAIRLHDGYHPKHNPSGVDLDACPVCGREAFSADGQDDLGMDQGPGRCLVCGYERSPGLSDYLAAMAYYEVRWADD
ncbi:hypothetical protein [Streptomyces sp. LS1784]|uniref:hypothetical protein n=1 Tax=Streptomyces sp. LS1784 TaxID=2851533 RepID=UPI001CCAF415|nr:hypothetical protein [Streptomyces sp. LS1784]